MKKQKIFVGASMGLVLALAACEDPEPANTEADSVLADEGLGMDEDLWTPEAGELDETQQANLDATDMEEEEREFTRYQEEDEQAAMSGGGQAPGGDMASGDMAGGDDQAMAEGDGDQAMAGGGDDAADGPDGDTVQPRPPRSQMTFDYLDRDGNGVLRLAEYAIWAVPLNPNREKQNDAEGPYARADQLNEAARSFFYYDRDGDKNMTEAEFQAVRDTMR